MAKLARLPANDRAPQVDAADPRPIRRLQTHYYAFLSYSHKDEEAAAWLHRELERFRVPSTLAGKLTDNGVIPKRLTPIFRDRHELAAADDLGEEIRAALASTRYLIVLCSPDAARSRWTNAEIEEFKRVRPDGCVFAAIVGGQPFASNTADDSDECFPPALRQKYDRRGRPTGKRAEPLAADLRDSGDGRRMGFLKLVAGMLGVGLDELVRRETTRRQRRLAWVAAASLAGMTVTSTLSVFALRSRDEARDQRRQAEGLVSFMLGDLREKLEPIGRLDALDAVGSRALKYFESQDKSQLSDDALAQRSRALTLIGEIANLRGDFEGALRRYREAMASTGELARRHPDDPQRLFDHAQNVFWVGEVAHQRGQLAHAEQSMREYKRLADRMVALDPSNRKWLMEVKYAQSGLGVILYEQQQYAEAAQLFALSLRIVESFAAAEPRNSEYQKSLVESLAWLSDAQFGEGQLDEAIAQRERQVALLDQLMRLDPNDAAYPQKAVPANRALGRLLASKGDLRGGLAHTQQAVAASAEVLRAEPDNSDSLEFAAGAHLELARILAADSRYAEAAAQIRASCDQSDRLKSLDAKVDSWRSLITDCLMFRAVLAHHNGSDDEALLLAQSALRTTQSKPGFRSPVDQMATARAWKLIGDLYEGLGNHLSAVNAWRAGLAIWPKNITENPRQTALHAQLLRALGAMDEAKRLESRLASIGYQRMI